MVTTTFDQTNGSALAVAANLGTQIRTLNPGSGSTYHPKVYLARSKRRVRAVVGSANLTGGLATNVEVGVVMNGTLDDQPLRVLSEWAESIWNDHRAEAWLPAAAEAGVRLERSFAAPRTAPSGKIFAHHHHYATTRHARLWTPKRIVGERRFSMPRRLTASTVWAAARGSAEPSSVMTQPLHLGLEVEVALPANSRLAAAMKALLDGVVASFHRHDGTGDLGLLASRIVGEVGPPEVTRLLLTGPQELGSRALVRPFAKSVQWNPADDLLVSVQLSRVRTASAQAKCRATLFEVDLAE